MIKLPVICHGIWYYNFTPENSRKIVDCVTNRTTTEILEEIPYFRKKYLVMNNGKEKIYIYENRYRHKYVTSDLKIQFEHNFGKLLAIGDGTEKCMINGKEYQVSFDNVATNCKYQLKLEEKAIILDKDFYFAEQFIDEVDPDTYIYVDNTLTEKLTGYCFAIRLLEYKEDSVFMCMIHPTYGNVVLPPELSEYLLDVKDEEIYFEFNQELYHYRPGENILVSDNLDKCPLVIQSVADYINQTQLHTIQVAKKLHTVTHNSSSNHDKTCTILDKTKSNVITRHDYEDNVDFANGLDKNRQIISPNTYTYVKDDKLSSNKNTNISFDKNTHYISNNNVENNKKGAFSEISKQSDIYDMKDKVREQLKEEFDSRNQITDINESSCNNSFPFLKSNGPGDIFQQRSTLPCGNNIKFNDQAQVLRGSYLTSPVVTKGNDGIMKLAKERIIGFPEDIFKTEFDLIKGRLSPGRQIIVDGESFMKSFNFFGHLVKELTQNFSNYTILLKFHIKNHTDQNIAKLKSDRVNVGYYTDESEIAKNLPDKVVFITNNENPNKYFPPDCQVNFSNLSFGRDKHPKKI